MKNIAKKIGVIGTGSVGASFLYAAVNQGLASNYVLIDAFPKSAEGNAIDLQDTQAVLPSPFNSVVSGTYKDIADADLLVICAGRPQKPGETRLNMVAGNAVIMKEIATEVKKSGFNGITLIASNPMDVLTLVYQEVTQFPANRVIGSGTTLDSSRLRRLVGAKLGINAQSVDAYLMGEHGDSAVAVWSHAGIMNQPISKFVAEGKIAKDDLAKLRDEAVHMAYTIIDLKRATFYGIADCLARISKAILNDEKTTWMVSAKVNGQYGVKNIYMGVPAVIGQNGWSDIIEWDLSADEKAGLAKSAAAIQVAVDAAMEAIKEA